MSNSGNPHQRNIYPWKRLKQLHQLLDAELKSKGADRRGPGRPRNNFARQAVNITLTEHEKNLLDQLCTALTDRMNVKVPRGLMIAFLVHYLSGALMQPNGEIELPEHVRSFVDLAEYLNKPITGEYTSGENIWIDLRPK